MKKILFLFPSEWDLAALKNNPAFQEYELICEGFDIFRFPESARLLWFNAPRYLDSLWRKYHTAQLAAVLSTNEQYGALLAAALARKLGLPATDPGAIILSQHKFYARQAQQVALPQATPRFALLPYSERALKAIDFPFPFFVKPVKAAFSVLARRVNNAQELKTHLTFYPWEKHIIKRLVKPFNDLLPRYSDFTIDAYRMIAEEILSGVQVNIDGYAVNGQVHILGIVDSIMYPGTQAFQRFEYPSRLPEAIQARLIDIAKQAVQSCRFDHGMFNVELFYDPVTDAIKIIEINPRLAAQFCDLYEKVDGYNPYQVLLDLATGQTPCIRYRAGKWGTAASFVFREFNGAVKIAPEKASIAWLNLNYPDAHLMTYINQGYSRWRETKWLGSYRYAVMNLGGKDREDLLARYQHICHRVRFTPNDRISLDAHLSDIRPHS